MGIDTGALRFHFSRNAIFFLVFLISHVPVSFSSPETVSKEDDGRIAHVNKRAMDTGIGGLDWTDDIDWGEGDDPEPAEGEDREDKDKESDRDRRRRERREERDRRRQEEKDRREKERRDREQRERDRRDRGRSPQPAPPPPPIRSLTSNEAMLARWLKSQGIGFPQDWMQLSLAMRMDLLRQYNAAILANGARQAMQYGMPSMQSRFQLFEQSGGRGSQGMQLGGVYRGWMDASGMLDPFGTGQDSAGSLGGGFFDQLGNFFGGGANPNVQPQPPTTFGPWPGETESEWVDRLAQNMWQTAYDKALWDLQKQRVARHNMGYRESDINEYQYQQMVQKTGHDPRAEADREYAKWIADAAARNANDPNYRAWLAVVDENTLREMNMHRDGTQRVSMGVAKRGSGMGPTLDWSKPDAADAAERAKQAAFNQWQRDRTAASQARNEAAREQRAQEQAARDKELADKRRARAQEAQQNSGNQNTDREPATASWVDEQGNTHLWTSNGSTRSITTTTQSGQSTTESYTRQPGSASATWTDSAGNTQQLTSDGQGGRTLSTTDSKGQTSTHTIPPPSSHASASWTDLQGSRHTLVSDGQGGRTQITTTPAGQQTTKHTLSGTGQASATWTDGSGNINTLLSNGRGQFTQVTTSNTGQVVSRAYQQDDRPSAIYADKQGNRVQLMGNSDGTKTQAVTRQDGTVEVTTIRNQGSFASTTDAAGNKRTISSNSDGTRTITTVTPEGKTTIEKVVSSDAAFVEMTAEDGTKISLLGLPYGARQVTTTTPEGRSTTVVRGFETDSASTQLKDGTTITVTQLGGGKREVVTTRPGGETTRNVSGGEPASATIQNPDGSRVTVKTNEDGTRDITRTQPDGTSVTETRGKEPDFVMTTKDDGTVVTVVDRGDGRHAVTVTTPDGKNRTTLHGKDPTSATAVGEDGTVVTVTQRSDGSRQVTTTSREGETKTEVIAKDQPDSAVIVREDGTTVTVTGRADGQRDVTNTSRDGSSKTETRGSEPVSVTSVDENGNQITVKDLGGGKREVITRRADGAAETEVRGGEEDSASSKDEDGYTTSAVKDKEGKIQVTTDRPENEAVSSAPDKSETTALTPDPQQTEEKKEDSGDASSPAKQEPAAQSSFTDNEGNRHTVVVEQDGTRRESIENKDGSKVETENRRDGTRIETTTNQEGQTTTVTTTRDENGNTTQMTTFSDGKTETVSTDARSGQVTTVTRDPNDRSGPYGGDGSQTVTVRDRDGNIVSEEVRDKYGNETTIVHHRDGTSSITTRDNRSHENTTLEFDERGRGIEIVRDENGKVISQKEVTVTEHTDELGRRVVTVIDQEGNATATAYNQDGSVSAYDSDARGARTLYERQRKDLGLSKTWDDLTESERGEYEREHSRQEKVRQDNQERQAWEREQERRLQEQRARDERQEQEFREEGERIREEIQKKYEEEEARIEKERQRIIEETRENQAREELAAAEQERQRVRQRIMEERFEEEVKNPADVNEVREWRIKIMMERMEQLRIQNQTALDSGRVDVVQPDGTTVMVELTEQERRDAQTRVHLVNNLEKILAIDESVNHLARLEITEQYSRLVARSNYEGDAREVYGEVITARDVYDLSDYRAARENSSDPYVEALESTAITRASVTVRQKVDEGILNGTEALARGLNDWFTSMNPADPFLQASLGIKTSGADIGRNLTVGERLWELGKGGVGLGADIALTDGLKNLMRQPGSSRVVPNGGQANANYRYDLDSGLPAGAARNLDADVPSGGGSPGRSSGSTSGRTPDGALPTEADLGINQNLNLLDLRKGESGIGRPTGVQPDVPARAGPHQNTQTPQGALPTETDLGISGNLLDARLGKSGLNPQGSSTAGNAAGAARAEFDPNATGRFDSVLPNPRPTDPKFFPTNADGSGPAGRLTGDVEAPSAAGGIPRSGPGPIQDFKNIPNPRGLGDANLTSVNHGGMNIDLRPGAKPPAGLTSAQRQEWNDVRAQHESIRTQRTGEGSDGGDDMLFPAGAQSTMPLPPGAYSNHLTDAQINQLFQPGRNLSAAEITAKADAIRTGRAPVSTLDPQSRAALDASMRAAFPDINLQIGNRNPAVSNPTLIEGTPQSLSSGSATQSYNGVLNNPGSTQQFDGTLSVPGSGTQRFNMEVPGSNKGFHETQVLNPTPITRNDGSPITGGRSDGVPINQPGTPIRSQAEPTVGAPREGTRIQPPPIEKRPITDDMVYNQNPPRPMDPNYVQPHMDLQNDPVLAGKRVAHWIDNPHVEADLDGQMREMLKLGAEAGSPGARRVLENSPAYTYQPDMDAPFGVFDTRNNVIRLNPYEATPLVSSADGLKPRAPIAIAGTMVHEAAHGRGLPGQIPARGGGDAPLLSPPKPGSKDLPAGQGQGAGYNEFRAFYEEAQFYYRVGQQNPKLLDGLDPSSRALRDGFKNAFETGGAQAAKDFINKDIVGRDYQRFYPTPQSYAQAQTQHRGGSNLRALQGQAAGMTPQDMAPNVDINKVFPPAPPAPGSLPPVPGPPPPLPGNNRITIEYPDGRKVPLSSPAKGSNQLEAQDSASLPSAASRTGESAGVSDAKVADYARQGLDHMSALKEDSTFRDAPPQDPAVKEKEKKGIISSLFGN